MKYIKHNPAAWVLSPQSRVSCRVVSSPLFCPSTIDKDCDCECERERQSATCMDGLTGHHQEVVGSLVSDHALDFGLINTPSGLEIYIPATMVVRPLA